MAAVANAPTYSDFSTTFLEHPVRRELAVITNENAIKQSIRNLVQTDFYERPFEPTKGCGIRGLLFEPISPQTAGAIEDAVRTAIENWEPRARIRSVKAEARPDQNYYSVLIVFTLINSDQPVTVPVLLYRVR